MNDTARIATNLRLLLIVEALARAGRPMTPTELNAGLRLPRQTIHRLCRTLVDEGFFVRSNDQARLQPSARLRTIATGLLSASGVDIGRHQVLSHIAGVVREAVNFVVPQAGGMVYLDRVDTDWPLRIQLPVGSQVPFHCTASGKTYLASLPRHRRRAFVNTLELRAFAANTILDREALLAETDRIAEQGYAIDNEEFMNGLVALAVPVTDTHGGFLSAIAFHGPSQRLDIQQALAHLPLMRQGAKQLRDLLAGE